MLRFAILFSWMLLFNFGLFAQNQPPSIDKISASADWNTNVLTIAYDVSDAENDPLEITLFLSDNGGRTYNLTPANPAGDVGFPVTPGTLRSITFDISGLAANMSTYTVRLVADDLQDFDFQALVNEVDSNRLRADLDFVEGVRHRTTGPVHLQAVRDSMSQLFINAGLYAEDQTFAYTGGYTGHNVFGTMPGTGEAEKVIVVDAHYDTVNNAPGADDNGSGTVGVMEIARLLSRYPAKKSLRFIGFDLEEAGLIGSIRYVTAGIPAGEQIEGVFNFEMIGYYSDQPNTQTLPAGFDFLFPAAYSQVVNNQYRGDFLTNVSNTNSLPVANALKNAALQYVPDLKVITLEVTGNGEFAPDLRRSDHTPFWDSGRKAVMLTDGANFRNECYHTPYDTFENKLSFRFMSNVVKATIAAAAQMAEIRHGDWATASFQNLVQTLTPPPCNLHMYASSVQKDRLYVRAGDCLFKDAILTLYDEKGALLATRAVDISPGETQAVTIPGLKPGVYAAHLQHAGGMRTEKIVIH